MKVNFSSQRNGKYSSHDWSSPNRVKLEHHNVWEWVLRSTYATLLMLRCWVVSSSFSRRKMKLCSGSLGVISRVWNLSYLVFYLNSYSPTYQFIFFDHLSTIAAIFFISDRMANCVNRTFLMIKWRLIPFNIRLVINWSQIKFHSPHEKSSN